MRFLSDNAILEDDNAILEDHCMYVIVIVPVTFCILGCAMLHVITLLELL